MADDGPKVIGLEDVEAAETSGRFGGEEAKLSWSDVLARTGAARKAQGRVQVSGVAIDELIHKTPLFKGRSHDFVETVLLHMRKLLYRPGQVLVEEGSTEPTSMFLLLWGTAEVSTMGEIVRTVHEGQSLGEAMLLGIATKWHTTAIAKTSCMVCELQRSALEETLMDFPEEREHFSRLVGQHQSLQSPDFGYDGSVLRHCASLAHCSDDFLAELETCLDRRLFFTGEELFHEGDVDGALFVLELGAVTLEIAGRAVRVEEIPRVHTKLSFDEGLGVPERKRRGSESEGTGARRTSVIDLDDECESQHGDDLGDLPEAAVLAELDLLGISKKTVTARARMTCDVRILYRSAFLQVLEKYPDDVRVLEHFTSFKHSDVFLPLDVRGHGPFRQLCCSPAFYDFLATHVEERLIPAGNRLGLDDFHKHMHNGAAGANLCVCRLDKGRVVLEGKRKGGSSEHDEVEKGPGTLFAGDVFWKKIVRAVEPCWVTVLHRGVVARALEELPADREFLLPALSQHRTHHKDKSAPVAKILRDRSIFASTSQAFLDEIVLRGKTRVFMPGDRIIEQGTDGTSMFILWMGTANVVLESLAPSDAGPVRTLTNIGGLAYGSVFGELVMLGVQSKRTASIIAATVCCTWEVEHKTTLGILDRHPVERANFLKLVEQHLDSLAAPRIIYHSLFADFHQQFRTLIGVNCERRLSFPGEVIVREGAPGDRFFIMNLGTASIEINHQHVMQVKGGSHFGFGVMTGSQDRYAATVVADTMCQVLIVTRSTYRHALQKYPDMRRVAQALEIEERNRLQKQRRGFEQMVRRRRGLKIIIDALRQSHVNPSNEEGSTDQSLLESVFHGWHNRTIRAVEAKREEEEMVQGNARRIAEWLERRRKQMATVKPRQDMKSLVDKNLARRGPLRLAKAVECSSPRKALLSELWDEAASPYLSPSPVWRRVPPPKSEAPNKRLPPLVPLPPGGPPPLQVPATRVQRTVPLPEPKRDTSRATTPRTSLPQVTAWPDDAPPVCVEAADDDAPAEERPASTQRSSRGAESAHPLSGGASDDDTSGQEEGMHGPSINKKSLCNALGSLADSLVLAGLEA